MKRDIFLIFILRKNIQESLASHETSVIGDSHANKIKLYSSAAVLYTFSYAKYSHTEEVIKSFSLYINQYISFFLLGN